MYEFDTTHTLCYYYAHLERYAEGLRDGARVSRGDTLLTLEAMKMETAVRAETSAEVAEVLARPGQAVDAKDLLVVLR